MRTIRVSAGEEIRDITELHPKLQEMAGAVIAYAWDSDIDFWITQDSIQIEFTPAQGWNQSPNSELKIEYRSTDETS